MNRYEMLIKKVKPLAYRFKSSNSIRRVCEYMKKCVNDEVYFDARDINPAILDSALIMLSKEEGYYILVNSEKTARIFSISHGTRKVYSLQKLPAITGKVVCHKGVPDKGVPSSINVVLRIV